MLKKINYKNYQEMSENSPHFLKGKEEAKEGKAETKQIKISWVKQLVSQRDWDNTYKKNNVYCHLGVIGGVDNSKGKKVGGKVKIGYWVVGDYLPRDCEPCSADELYQIDNYRRASNILPTPLL